MRGGYRVFQWGAGGLVDLLDNISGIRWVVRGSNLSSRIVAPGNMAVALSTLGRVDCGVSLAGWGGGVWFYIGGTGGRASVTIFWVKVVGLPVQCQVVGTGLWLQWVSSCGLGAWGSDWVGVYWVGWGRVGFPVAGRG